MSMLYEFNEPAPCLLNQGMKDGVDLPKRPFPFAAYLEEVIFTMPYWRSSDEAAEQAEEVIDQIEAKVSLYVVRASTLEALRTQMKLADTLIVQQNPVLVRPSIRFVRVVNNARKHREPPISGAPCPAPPEG